jgi:hypothetical protein
MICHIFLELLRKKLRFAVLTRGDIEIPQTCWPCSSLFAVNSAPPLRIVDAQRNYLLLLIVFKPKFVFIRFRILNSFSLLPLTIIIFLWLSRRIFTIVPETYNVFRVYRVAALLYLQCMLYIKLFPTLNILYFYICASSSVCVCVCVCSAKYGCFLEFVAFLLSRYTLLVCCWNDFDMVSVAPIIDINFDFILICALFLL